MRSRREGRLSPGLPGVSRRVRMRRIFAYDRARFLKFSPHSRETKAGALASIVMTYHIVEKGLTMPDFRLGFGREKLLSLIAALEDFADKYGTDEPQFRAAVAVVAEYAKTHEEAGFELDEERSRAISALLARVPVKPSHQIEMTRERYWADLDASFEKFSASRGTPCAIFPEAYPSSRYAPRSRSRTTRPPPAIGNTCASTA